MGMREIHRADLWNIGTWSKLLAEGADIEADLVTMSSFYLESAQEEHPMFQDLEFETGALDEYPSYYTPITARKGRLSITRRW